MNKQSWTLDVKEDPDTGDAIIEFPTDLLEAAGWQEGDVLEWKELNNGAYQLTKKEKTQWVLVETVSTFRHRYVVEVPVGTDDYGYDKKEWALDTVTMNEAKEFSQYHLGEQIVSHRVVTQKEALALCDEDNDYTKTWNEETKLNTFFTYYKEVQ